MANTLNQVRVGHNQEKISALLELGSGFNPDFTGRENTFLNGVLMGYALTETKKAR